MQYLTCANLSLPLPLVQSISWAKTAKTVEKKGGVIEARGFEPCEVSARVVLNHAVCDGFGLSFRDMADLLSGLTPGRLDPSSMLRIAGIPIYPELEFSLTNCNRTVTADYTGWIDAMELDLVFSGVARSKEVSRERALQMDAMADIPLVSMELDGKRLSVQDGLAVVEMQTEPDAIRLVVECGTDLDLVSRDDFLEKFIDGGKVIAELPTGTTEFYAISAYLVGNELSIDGSIFPAQSQQFISHTWYDSDIYEIVPWLCGKAGIECDCRARGAIDYYHANGAPLDCLRAFLESAGLVISYRQGRATVAFLPSEIVAAYELQYVSMESDDDGEPIKGCVWNDGLNWHITGAIDANALRVHSCFRAAADYSARCLALARYRAHRIVVRTEIDPRIDSHSVVSIATNDAVVNCLVSWYAVNWVDNTQEIELNYL